MNIKKTLASLIVGILICSTLAGCTGNDGVETDSKGELVIAFEVKSDYENIDENPQQLADYLAEELNYEVSLYSVDSEGAMLGSETLTSLSWMAVQHGLVGSSMASMPWQQTRSLTEGPTTTPTRG